MQPEDFADSVPVTESEASMETPLERAARLEAVDPAVRAQEEHHREATIVMQDVEDYIAETDPASLTDAAAQISAWKMPEDEDLGSGTGEPMDSSTMTAVFSAGSEAEANIVRGVLHSEGIPAAFDSIPSPAMGHVFSVSESAWADIVVPAEFVDAARAAIANALSAGADDDSEVEIAVE